MKKYPILYPICSTYGISKRKIDQTFRAVDVNPRDFSHEMKRQYKINNKILE